MTSKKTIKQENGTSGGGSNNNRIQLLEKETESLKDDVKKFLSIITVQTEQLARQDKLLNDLQDERKAKASNRLTICLMLFLLVIFLVTLIVWFGPTILPGEDTTLHLNVKATPVKAPFITAGVKVRFTMGDLLACVKGTFSGDTIDLSLN